jgi:hypothetical protein
MGPTSIDKCGGFASWLMRTYRFVQALKIGGETTMPATEATVIDTTTDPGKQ